MASEIIMAKVNVKIEKLDDFVRNNPNDSPGYIDLAKAHREAGNTSRAREVLDKLLNTSSGEGEALILRAELLAEQNDWIGTWRDLKEASALGANVPSDFRYKAYYRQWLILHNQGWRPEPASRYIALVLCSILGMMMVYMSLGVLKSGGILGALIVFGLGIAFIWAGLAIGGLSLWLKKLQDVLSPGWDEPVLKTKSKKKSKGSKEKSKGSKEKSK